MEDGPRSNEPLLEFEKVYQSFTHADGSASQVLSDISFTVSGSDTVCVLGPSGCGKSTVLRLVSGMYHRYTRMPTSGAVRIAGKVVTEPHDDVLTVFQKPILKSWLNIRSNVALPFKSKLWSQSAKAETRQKLVDEMLEAVGLKEVADRKPYQLSGGMQQRAALAARLVLRPKILCLDEPFSALDPQTRSDMQNLVIELWKKYPCLSIFVTHDVTEALRIADRIIVLSNRPAKIVADLMIAQGKPRPASWFQSEQCVTLERLIINNIREAANSEVHGQLNVEV